MTLPASLRARKRLSLTWRVLALNSLLLLALVVLFSWLGHANLTRQFEQSREKHFERQVREIRLALSRSDDSLRQLASLVAATQGLGKALENERSNNILDALAAQWPTLQLEGGIDEILVFDAQGVQQGSWGESQANTKRPIKRWIRQVMESEMPLTALRCSTDCRQYAAAPILVEGESAGIAVLSRSLADVTRQAQQVSDGDVGLLVVGPMAPSSLDTERRLDKWHGYVVALTRQERNLPLLRDASQQASIPNLVEAPLRLRYQGSDIELSAVRMKEDGDHRTVGYFLIASDITQQIRAINQDTRNLIFVGLVGWIAAELLLLAILLSPMARLRRISSILPTLALGRFPDARAAIQHPRRRLVDEIDILEGATLELSTQLETLEKEVTARGEELAERVDELACERDFISSLLDTARVFIVTQDADGRINLVNDYALSVMAVGEERLLDRLFSDVFSSDAPAAMKTLTGSPQEERMLVTSDGRRLTIAWYHAPLPAGTSGQAGRISVGLDITERKAAEARLTWLAERDPLTGLFNRRYLQDALRGALQHERHGALLLMDLDQFKDINELSGHQAGDQLLRKVAGILVEEFGHRCIVARLGGDEFAMLLEGADEDLAIRIAQQLNKILESLGFNSGGRRHRIAASMGIAMFPAHGDNTIDLMANADMAMYKAKGSGTQRWHLLSTVENAKDELQKRVYWEGRVHRALEEDAFELMVQPIVRLEDRDVRHYEVLIRMRDDDGSLISPARFIPIAERSGQIISLDRWVLHHSLSLLGQLRDQGITLAVNLSGHSLHDDGLNQFLSDRITASGADPNYLILEITETAAVTDFSTARGVLQAIRDLGCHTALDDFGVGFSSFHYLGQLPVDYIKIDGSFIRNLSVSTENRVIVKAIADIAAGFGKQTIAEFVEQEALLPILTEYGISFGQGFYLGEPRKIRDVFHLDFPENGDT